MRNRGISTWSERGKNSIVRPYVRFTIISKVYNVVFAINIIVPYNDKKYAPNIASL